MNARTAPWNSLVSIIVVAYNAEETIGFALASLAAQTIGEWEAVVLDDGSTDQTLAVAKSFRDPRIRIKRFQSNRGRGAARQAALEQCRGEFIAYVDADDWWYPWKLERQLEFFEGAPSLGLVSTAMASVGIDGSFRGVRRLTGSSDLGGPRPPLRSPARITVPHAASMVRADIAKAVGYDRTLNRAEDFVFLARVLSRTSYALSPTVLYAYADQQSFQAESAVKRYLSVVLACRRLVRDFGFRAVLHGTRSFLQAVLSMVPVAYDVFPQNCPAPPTREESRAFDKAKAQVHEVLSSTSC